MCRLFGFRSVLQSQVHRSLVSADNALAVQSEEHPDGWGVAYYLGGAPHLIRSAGPAMGDKLFHRVSGIVTSQTVLAHIRKATQGELTPLNSHPFQYGRWVMAHNGDVPTFATLRPRLVEEISPMLRGFLLGDTDSEVIFFLFLTELSREVELHRPGTPLAAVVRALRRAVARVRELADPPADPERSPDDAKRSLLTIMVTDGELMVGHKGGKELYFSTHKQRCPERDTCPFFAPECETGAKEGDYVNHLILSSEPLQGENVWTPLHEGEMIAIDHFMRFHRFAA